MVFQEQGIAIVLMTTLAIISILLVFKYVEKLAKYKVGIDFFLLFYAVQSMVRHFIQWVDRGQFYNFLSLQICYFTMYVYIYYYFSKNRKMLPFLHIFGFLGIVALFIPGHQFSFTNPLSYIFMIDHIILAVMPFYIIVAHKYDPVYKDIKKLLYVFVPFFTLANILNEFINSRQLFGANGEHVETWINEANYFFLYRNPITMYSLSPWIVMVAQLGGIVLFGYIATYLGKMIYKKVYKNQKET